MRKLLPLVAAVLSACGSSSSSGPSYLVKDSAVFFDHADNCLFGTIPTGVSVAVVDVTDYTAPPACASMQANDVAAGGAAAGLIIVRADFVTPGGPAPGLKVETYPFFDLATVGPPANKQPPLDGLGTTGFFTGALVKCGADGGSGESLINGGSVTVTAVNEVAGTISGSVNASLVGGGSLKGSFSASLCPIPPIGVCAAVQTLSLNLPTPACL